MEIDVRVPAEASNVQYVHPVLESSEYTRPAALATNKRSSTTVGCPATALL